MKIKYSRIISFLLIVSLLLSLSLTSCKTNDKKENTKNDNNATSGDNNSQELPSEDSEKQDSKKDISFAEMIDFYRIQYTLPKGATNTKDSLNLKVFDGEKAMTVLNITPESNSRKGIITLAEKLDITKSYSLAIDGYNEKTVIPTFIFDTEEFIENYSYRGDDLGATLTDDATTFKVWAPTASRVVLNLFTDDESSAILSVDMAKGDSGVWSYTAECGQGTYYTYSVTTQIGTSESADPYAKSTSFDGERSVVVDLSTTNPDDWSKSFDVGINNYSEAIIWGVNPEEFSKGSSFNHSGYLAFTERGLINESGESIGVDYLVNLGITHINLLPVCEYETHTSNNSNKNYGSDNFNSPNPNFSSTPYSPDAVIKEYKEMVKSLHEAGIGVIMSIDIAHSDKTNTSFDKIVPYYYYRYTDSGIDASSSGCGRDTASERYMVSKFMKDTISHLIKEYGIDGFSFEAIDLYTIEAIDEIEKTVHAINPKAIIIGKCHSLGITTAKEIGAITPLNNAIGGVAVFNDAMGDEFINTAFGKYTNSYAESFSVVLDGIKGVITDEYGDIEVSNIVNCITPGDKINSVNATEENKLASMRLYMTLIAASKACIYIDASEFFVFAANHGIDWSAFNKENSMYSTVIYFQELLKIRRDYEIFTYANSVVYANLLAETITIFIVNTSTNEKILIIANPTSKEVTYTLDGNWYMIANGIENTEDASKICEGKVSIPAYTAIILTNSITTIT